MSDPLIKTASNGQALHYSVGAVIERDGKYLLVDRVNPPPGFAGLAGHMDASETDPEKAMRREILEESGLTVTKSELVLEEEVLWNYCKSGPAHYWYLYKVEVEGEVKQNTEEEKSIGWYSREELSKLNLEKVWRHWFEKLGIIPYQKRITLCGSMKFYDEKLSIKQRLEQMGYIVEIADRFLDKQENSIIGGKAHQENSVYQDPTNQIWDIKKGAILAHFRKVFWSDAILVVNYEKNDIPGYVGGNTLMEIGFALWYRKKIYLLNDIPVEVSYREEIFGMKPTVLSGDLNKIDL